MNLRSLQVLDRETNLRGMSSLALVYLGLATFGALAVVFVELLILFPRQVLLVAGIGIISAVALLLVLRLTRTRNYVDRNKCDLPRSRDVATPVQLLETAEGAPYYQFGQFSLNTKQKLLVRDGKPIPMTPKAIETLLTLVENAGRLVTREELLDRIWPDSFVDEGILAFHISQIRKALGDERNAGNRFVETVPRRGYRFIASVGTVSSEASSFGLEGRARQSVKTAAITDFLTVLLSGSGIFLGVSCLLSSALMGAWPIAQTITGEFGVVFLGASLVHLGSERIFRRYASDALLREATDISKSAASVGIEAVYQSVPTSELTKLFGEAKSIRILTTWHPEEEDLQEELWWALSQRTEEPTRVDFFVCDPNSELLKLAARPASDLDDSLRHRVFSLLRTIRACTKNQAKATVSFTFYDALVTDPVVQCDDLLFIGLSLRDAPSSPWLKVGATSRFGRKIVKQFEFDVSLVTAHIRTEQELEQWITRGSKGAVGPPNQSTQQSPWRFGH